MAPTDPWGKKNTSASGFPGLKPTQQSINDPPPKSQYEEIQENELIALSSIYGDDFQRLETKQGAWKVRTLDLNVPFFR
jgi:translation initiation factor 2-alpha kinase 4